MSETVLWNELGNVYIKIGAVDEAISAYLKAIEIDPTYGWPYSNMGFAQAQKGNFLKAIGLYKKSIELMQNIQDKAISWNRLGDAYRNIQDYKQAFDAYRTAGEIAKNQIPAPVTTSIPRPLPTEALDVTVLFPEAILADEPTPSQTYRNQAKESSPIPDAEPFQPLNPVSFLTDTPMTNEKKTAEEDLLLVESEPDEIATHDKQLDQPVKPMENRAKNISEWLKELLKGDAERELKSLDLGPKVLKRTLIDEDALVTAGQGRAVSPSNQHTPAKSLESPSHQPTGTNYPIESQVDTLERSNFVVYDPERDGQTIDRRHEESTPLEQPTYTSQSTIRIPPKPSPTQPLDPIMAEIKKYEKIVSLNDRNDRAWDTLGKLYKSLGRYEDAIKAFEKAIALTPHHEAYHYNLGLVFTVQNRYLDAIESFQNAIALNDQYILAHGALAGCYRRLGKQEEASDHIKLATPLMAEESEYNRACFNAICGNNDQAIELLRTALMNQEVSLDWVQSDPDLESIRNDARYQALIDESQGALVTM